MARNAKAKGEEGAEDKKKESTVLLPWDGKEI
jgi:hypothetical protein